MTKGANCRHRADCHPANCRQASHRQISHGQASHRPAVSRRAQDLGTLRRPAQQSGNRHGLFRGRRQGSCPQDSFGQGSRRQGSCP